MLPEEKQIGFLKYDGQDQDVEAGIMDARSLARALNGFDDSLRYFVTQKSPNLVGTKFDIPIKIEEGSVDVWLVARDVIVAAGAIYGATAVREIAKNDFKNIRSKDVFLWGLKAIQWMIRVKKHLKAIALKNSKPKWTEEEVHIANEAGLILVVPREFFEVILKAPKNLLSDMADVVNDGRTLSIGVGNKTKSEEETISNAERGIFFDADEDLQDILFPEFLHGMRVSLSGVVTRGNGVTNTIGFFYNGHILTCKPTNRDVTVYKDRMFATAEIKGTIERYNPQTKQNDSLRPQILFDDLILIGNPSDPDQPDLFNGNS